MLHGLFGSLDNWAPVNAILSKRFRVFAVDQRNHGHSPHADEMDYGLMADDVAEFMNQHGLERAVLLGHSMGGKTAMQLALAHPERVAKLIVVDISPGEYPPRHNAVFRALLPLDLAAFKTRREIEEALAPAIPTQAVRQFLLKSAERVPGGGFRWRMGLKEIHHNYPALSAAIRSDRPFPGPALFVRGEHSDYLREQDLSAIRALFPQAEMTMIPGAGHWVQVDNRDGFLRVVEEFLARALPPQ